MTDPRLDAQYEKILEVGRKLGHFPAKPHEGGAIWEHGTTIQQLVEELMNEAGIPRITEVEIERAKAVKGLFGRLAHEVERLQVEEVRILGAHAVTRARADELQEQLRYVLAGKDRGKEANNELDRDLDETRRTIYEQCQNIAKLQKESDRWQRRAHSSYSERQDRKREIEQNYVTGLETSLEREKDIACAVRESLGTPVVASLREHAAEVGDELRDVREVLAAVRKALETPELKGLKEHAEEIMKGRRDAIQALVGEGHIWVSQEVDLSKPLIEAIPDPIVEKFSSRRELEEASAKKGKRCFRCCGEGEVGPIFDPDDCPDCKGTGYEIQPMVEGSPEFVEHIRKARAEYQETGGVPFDPPQPEAYCGKAEHSKADPHKIGGSYCENLDRKPEPLLERIAMLGARARQITFVNPDDGDRFWKLIGEWEDGQ